MKRLALTIVGLLAAFGAQAADLPVWQAPVYSPPPFWDPLYAGLYGSFSFGGKSSKPYKGLLCTNLNPSDCANADTSLPSGSNHGARLGGGLQLGFDPLSSNGVFGGFVVDVTALDRSNSIAATRTFSHAVDLSEVSSSTFSSSQNWLATARLRLGLDLPSVRPYITGGLAFGDYSLSGSVLNTVMGSQVNSPPYPGVVLLSGSSSSSGTKLGFAVGLGAEFRLAGPVTFLAEYLYYDLGQASMNVVTSQPSNPPVVVSSLVDPVKLRLNGSLVRVGVNYRFSTY